MRYRLVIYVDNDDGVVYLLMHLLLTHVRQKCHSLHISMCCKLPCETIAMLSMFWHVVVSLRDEMEVLATLVMEQTFKKSGFCFIQSTYGIIFNLCIAAIQSPFLQQHWLSG